MPEATYIRTARSAANNSYRRCHHITARHRARSLIGASSSFSSWSSGTSRGDICRKGLAMDLHHRSPVNQDRLHEGVYSHSMYKTHHDQFSVEGDCSGGSVVTHWIATVRSSDRAPLDPRTCVRSMYHALIHCLGEYTAQFNSIWYKSGFKLVSFKLIFPDVYSPSQSSRCL